MQWKYNVIDVQAHNTMRVYNLHLRKGISTSEFFGTLHFLREVVSCRLLPLTVCCLLSVNCHLMQRWHHHRNAHICHHILETEPHISFRNLRFLTVKYFIVLLMTEWVHPVGDDDYHPVGDNDDREQALVVQEPPWSSISDIRGILYLTIILHQSYVSKLDNNSTVHPWGDNDDAELSE